MGTPDLGNCTPTSEAWNGLSCVLRSRSRENAKWRRKDRSLQHAEHLQLNSDQREVSAEWTFECYNIYIPYIFILFFFTPPPRRCYFADFRLFCFCTKPFVLCNHLSSDRLDKQSVWCQDQRLSSYSKQPDNPAEEGWFVVCFSRICLVCTVLHQWSFCSVMWICSLSFWHFVFWLESVWQSRALSLPPPPPLPSSPLPSSPPPHCVSSWATVVACVSFAVRIVQMCPVPPDKCRGDNL